MTDTGKIFRDALYDELLGGYCPIVKGLLKQIEYTPMGAYEATIHLFQDDLHSYNIHNFVRQLNKTVSVHHWTIGLTDNRLEMLEYLQKQREKDQPINLNPPKQYLVLTIQVNAKPETKDEAGEDK
jgi:hypothetical protein